MTTKIISITNTTGKYGNQRKEVFLEVDGMQAKVAFTTRSYNETWRTRKRHSRMSVYFDGNGETLMENFVNRTRRPFAEYRRLAKPFLKALDLPTTGWVWNQYAYCSCPCSPAFVSNQTIQRKVSPHGDYLRNVDISILLYTDALLVDESKELDMNRLEAIAGVLEGVR